MARACRARGVPLIHVSTDYVYDGTKAGPYLESDATAPINAYGRTKLAGEDLIRGHLPAHVILRTSWIYSARGRNFMKTMLRLGAERDEVRVVNDQCGAPTSAHDLAGAIVTIARQITGGSPAFGTYHYANAGEASWCGFAGGDIPAGPSECPRCADPHRRLPDPGAASRQFPIGYRQDFPDIRHSSARMADISRRGARRHGG